MEKEKAREQELTLNQRLKLQARKLKSDIIAMYFVLKHPQTSWYVKIFVAVIVGYYADDGISGTSTKKSEQFNRLIEDCKAGKIDMIITKSISRFARNTLDCLNFVRLLKDLGIGVIFEKENINTLDSKDEVFFLVILLLPIIYSYRKLKENTQRIMMP